MRYYAASEHGENEELVKCVRRLKNRRRDVGRARVSDTDGRESVFGVVGSFEGCDGMDWDPK